MTKFFKKFKKCYFWTFLAHFPNFLGKNFFFHEIELLCATPYSFLAPRQNLEKSNYPISRKHPIS